VRESHGAFVAVPDEAILDAQRETGRRAGLFGEPAAVAALAGLRQAVADGIVSRRSSALAMLTGSGLKDVRSALRAAGDPVNLPPDDTALDDHLRERPLG
jgi:threonine synthase